MIVMTALGAGLAFVPLFDVLGFELAFAVGLVASLGAADVAAAQTARDPAPSVWAAWGRAALHGLMLTLPPLILITLNGVRVPPCDPGVGLLFYALLPGLSVLCATTVGVVSGTLLGHRPRLAIVAAWLVLVGSIAVGVYRFYAAPPIFAYDPFAGYFPGTLYDEDLTVPPALLWARLYHAALCVGALALVDGWTRRRVTSALAGLLAVTGAGVLLHRSAEYGFAVSAADIAAALGGRVETEHFVIIYPRGAAFEPEMPRIAEDHELRYAQAAAVFGLDDDLKITSFYFETSEEKARWMGALRTYIAKPWRREIYVTHEEFPHDVLRHEIAHVLAGVFGDPIFGVSVDYFGWPPFRFNVGLIEGAAVAADWPTTARLTPHEAARAMLDLGYLPPLARILTPGFLSFSSARSYTTAGSFCRFLIERHGAERFRALYRAGGRPADFPLIYGKHLAEVDAEWRGFLGGITVPDEEREIARERFRRPGIFQRPCPHLIARLERKAGEELAARRPDRAVALYGEVCDTDPGEPSHRLGLAAALERAGRGVEARQIYAALGADDDLSTPLRARALLNLVDLLARAGDREDARAAAERALALPVDESTRRNLALRRTALSGGAEGDALAAYLFARVPAGGDPDPLQLLARAREFERAAPESALPRYLAGRMLYQRGIYADAASALADAARRGLADPLVARENDRLLATAAWLAGDRPLACAAAGRLAAPEQPPSVRRLGEDWLLRCNFAGK
jgi:hypothetical protein